MTHMPDRSAASVTIERRVELATAREHADLYQAAPNDLVQTLGLRHTIQAGATLVGAAHVANVHFNRVTAFGVAVPATSEALAGICAFYHPLRVQFALNLSPLAQSPQITRWLDQRGFVMGQQTAILAYAGAMLPPSTTPLRVQRIGREHAHTWSQTLVDAFDLPPFMVPWMQAVVGRPGWYHYLVWDGAAAVAAGTLYVYERIGHFGWAATLPSHRSRGAHSALIGQRVRDAQALGCGIIAVDTNANRLDDNVSFHNLRRVGFEVLYLRPEYLAPAP